MKKLATSLVAVCLVAAVGCGGEKSKEEISETLKDKGTTEVLKEAANDTYDPPADGKLTEGQMEMYLKVREREKEIAKVAREQAQTHAKKADEAGEKSIGGMMEAFKTLGSVADLATADIRAAQELGYNTAEYQWVKTTILSVSTADFSQQMASATGAMLDASYTQLKQQYDAATDPATKKALGDALAEYEKSKGELSKQAEANTDPAFAHNKALISKYEGTLKALSTELAKYSDDKSTGDLDKQMSDIQKAAADAQAKAQAK